MKESIFQYELKKTIEEAGGICYKFPDSIMTSETRFIPPKPADLIAIIDRRAILIECKIIKEVKNIYSHFFGNTKEKKEKINWQDYHQVKELYKFFEKGNDAYYAINLKIPRQINKLILIHIKTFYNIFIEKNVITKEELIQLAENGTQGTKKRFPGIVKKI